MLPYWLELSHRIAGVATPVILGGATLYFAVKRLRFDRESIRNKRDDDVIKWSIEAIGTISHLHEILKYVPIGNDATSKQKYVESLAKLSSQIDSGRFLFPNHHPEKYGDHKEGAYRGIRHEALDCLVEMYDIAADILIHGRDVDVVPEFMNSRRDFVSIVQNEVDPRTKIAFVRKETKKDLVKS